VKSADATFATIIESTPLVSIDLVINNEHGKILLGFRRNRPAQGYWFVPGGRIRKNERIQDALVRITHTELGIAPGKGRLLGAFDHLYDDNYFGLPGMGTHYIALAYAFNLSCIEPITQDDQHTEIKWWDVDSLLASPEVHDNTKLYFRPSPNSGFVISNSEV
jgi:colanic acid biosynthesis protein WcaH